MIVRPVERSVSWPLAVLALVPGVAGAHLPVAVGGDRALFLLPSWSLSRR